MREPYVRRTMGSMFEMMTPAPGAPYEAREWIERVLPFLTQRDVEMLRMMAEGYGQKEIGQAFGLSRQMLQQLRARVTSRLLAVEGLDRPAYERLLRSHGMTPQREALIEKQREVSQRAREKQRRTAAARHRQRAEARQRELAERERWEKAAEADTGDALAPYIWYVAGTNQRPIATDMLLLASTPESALGFVLRELDQRGGMGSDTGWIRQGFYAVDPDVWERLVVRRDPVRYLGEWLRSADARPGLLGYRVG